MKHTLQIKSLHDAQAACSCGRWSYSCTGAKTRAQVKREHREHVLSDLQAAVNETERQLHRKPKIVISRDMTPDYEAEVAKASKRMHKAATENLGLLPE